MLTAEQLYELIAHKDDPDAGAEAKPEKKAAKALFSLADYYKEHPASISNTGDMGELLFSAALIRMVETADRVAKKGANAADFKELTRHALGEFNAAYDKLPEEIREHGPVREAFDVILPEQNPDKLAYEREVDQLMMELIREHEDHILLKEGRHPVQTGPELVDPDELETLKKAKAGRIDDIFNTLLAMDDLYQASGWNSALDPEKRKTALKKAQDSPIFAMARGGVREVARDPAGLADMFRQLGRTELQARVDPAAKAVEAEKQKAAAAVYERDSKLLAEDTLRVFRTVRQLIDDTHPAHRDRNMSQEDLQALLEQNNENLRMNIATLVAMDDLRKKGDFVSATDPKKLEDAADKVMAEQTKDLDYVMDILTKKVGSPDLVTLFRSNKRRPELSTLMAGAAKSVEQKTKDAFDENYNAMVSQVVQIKEELDQLRKGGPEAKQNGKSYAESLEELQENLASLIAVDSFRRKGEFSVLSDPYRLKTETDKVKRSKLMETAMASLAPGNGDGKSLEEVARSILKRATLANTFASSGGGMRQAAGVTENQQAENVVSGKEKAEQAQKVEETGAEKTEAREPQAGESGAGLGGEPGKKAEEPETTVTEPEWKAGGFTKGQQPETAVSGGGVTEAKPEEPADEKKEPGKAEEVTAEEPELPKKPVFPEEPVVPEEPLRKSAPEHPQWRTVPEEPQRKSVPAEGKGAENKYSPDCPIMRFQAKLKELREDIEMSTVSPLYELDVTQCRVGLARLFALRDMGKTNPLEPVTDDQVKARIHQIYHTKGNPEFKLYQDIDKKILSGDTRVFKRVVGAVTGEETSKEFAQTVSKASWIKLQNAVEEQKAPGVSHH